MADYAPNYTHRYRVRYSVLGRVHVAATRYGRGAYVPTAGLGTMEGLLETMASLFDTSFTILGAEACAADSEVFLPTTAPSLDGMTGGPVDDGWRPSFLTFNGRSVAGSKARLMLFGCIFNPLSTTEGTANDWRITSTENATVASAVALLNADAAMTAIDAEAVVWYPYVNVGMHAGEQRKRRRG